MRSHRSPAWRSPGHTHLFYVLLGLASGPGCKGVVSAQAQSGGTSGAGQSGGQPGSSAAATGGLTGAGASSMPTSNSLVIVGTDVPGAPEDDVALTVHVIHADLPSLSLDLELSTDGGVSFRSAHATALPAVADGAIPGQGRIALTWHSMKDVSFHAPANVELRITPIDRVSTGAPYRAHLRIANLRAAARHVAFPMFAYGGWDSGALAIAKRHDLVVLQPGSANVSRQLVEELERGLDPSDPSDDVIVLGYVSVGEDNRTVSLSDAQARDDPRFRGDGSGPRVDPRGPTPDGGPLDGIAPLGNPSPGGAGWASYYLDDDSVGRGKADGIPDRNASFGGYFVNAGDPRWFEVVDLMTLDGPDAVAGFQEILNTSTGRGLGCDGVFLDTIDTAAPNAWTRATDSDFTQFEWTGPGLSQFVARVHSTYPDRLVLQNRGGFFLDPDLPQYASTTRGSIDFFLFESYRLSSSSTDGIDPFFFADNQHNVMPKLVAEAQRPDGFRILSLGYAEGTGDTAASATLLGQGAAALDSLLEDIRVTEQVAGFRHYLTNAGVDLVNAFVRDHTSTADTTPPAWSSVWNTNVDRATGVPAPPTPRIGIQSAVPTGAGQITVAWDVAVDFNRVGYALYYAEQPFDFQGDPHLGSTTRVVLTPRVPAAYVASFGAGTLPFEATIGSLTRQKTYHLTIRAFDSVGNEDQNAVSLVITIP